MAESTEFEKNLAPATDEMATQIAEHIDENVKISDSSVTEKLEQLEFDTDDEGSLDVMYSDDESENISQVDDESSDREAKLDKSLQETQCESNTDSQTGGETKETEKNEMEKRVADLMKNSFGFAYKPMITLLALYEQNLTVPTDGKVNEIKFESVSGDEKILMYLDIVDKDFEIDMSIFEGKDKLQERSKEAAGFLLYCCKLVMDNLQQQNENLKKYKITVDQEKVTVYIDKDHPKRVGILVKQIR